MTDSYLIEYLTNCGYTRAEITSPNFNVLSLTNVNLEKPIDLSKINNIDDIKIFFGATPSFLITQEDIENSKVYEISKMLSSYKLIASEPGLKLNKLFLSPNQCIIYDIKQGAQHNVNAQISLENFDLTQLEVETNDRNADKTNLSTPTNNKIYVLYLNNDNPSQNTTMLLSGNSSAQTNLTLNNCSNLDMANFEQLQLGNLKFENCSNIISSVQTNARTATIQNYAEDISKFLSYLDTAYLSLNNVKSLDLSSIHTDSLNATDILNCYATNPTSISNASFLNINFNNLDAKIDFNNLRINNCVTPAIQTSEIFTAKYSTINNCDFSTVLSIASQNLTLQNISGVTQEFETLVDKGTSISINGPLEGYDVRRKQKVLYLNDEANKDLLEDSNKLRGILENNKNIQYISVSPNLSIEQKEILSQLAPNVGYLYESYLAPNNIFNADNLIDTYNLKENQQEKVTFEQFMESEKMYNTIINGISPEWSELAKFKYLYIQLGKIISYDINVLNILNDEIDSYNRANLITRNVFSNIQNGLGVCAGYSDAYKYICQKAGLTCECESNADHRYNLIEYTDGNGQKQKSYCDLTWDARDIKVNLSCLNFGKSAKNFYGHPDLKYSQAIDIPDENSIDNEIGYHYSDQNYSALINDAKKQENLEDQIKYLVKNLTTVQDISQLSNHEAITFSKFLLGKLNINPENLGYTHTFIRKNERTDKEVRDILWIKTFDENQNEKYLYYTFNADQQALKTLDKDTIEELLAAEMIEYYKDQKIPGIDWNEPQKRNRNAGIER